MTLKPFIFRTSAPGLRSRTLVSVFPTYKSRWGSGAERDLKAQYVAPSQRVCLLGSARSYHIAALAAGFEAVVGLALPAVRIADFML